MFYYERTKKAAATTNLGDDALENEVDQRIDAKKKIIHKLIESASRVESEDTIDSAIKSLNLLFQSLGE